MQGLMSGVEKPEPVLFAAPDIRAEDIEAVSAVLRSGWITTGLQCAEFEAELAAYLGGDVDVAAVASCTAALEIAAAVFGLGAGQRVGIPTWTFASSALSMMRHGAIPVLLDIDPETLNVSQRSLQRAIENGLDAVVLVHFGGVPVDSEIHRLCDHYRVPVIEDAAHALGSTDHRGRIGSSAVATCFSFYATKNLTSAEGGALATTDAQLADFARSYRLHGLSADAYDRYRPGRPVYYDLVAGGIKANFPDLLAALARSQLGRLDEMQARRRALVTRYRELLASAPSIQVIPPEPVEGGADHLLLVRLPPEVDREEIRTSLATDGIGTSVHFQPLHTLRWLRERSEISPGGLPVADSLKTRVLSLPLHNCMTLAEVGRVCDSLVSSLRLVQ